MAFQIEAPTSFAEGKRIGDAINQASGYIISSLCPARYSVSTKVMPDGCSAAHTSVAHRPHLLPTCSTRFWQQHMGAAHECSTWVRAAILEIVQVCLKPLLSCCTLSLYCGGQARAGGIRVFTAGAALSLIALHEA